MWPQMNWEELRRLVATPKAEKLWLRLSSPECAANLEAAHVRHVLNLLVKACYCTSRSV